MAYNDEQKKRFLEAIGRGQQSQPVQFNENAGMDPSPDLLPPIEKASLPGLSPEQTEELYNRNVGIGAKIHDELPKQIKEIEKLKNVSEQEKQALIQQATQDYSERSLSESAEREFVGRQRERDEITNNPKLNDSQKRLLLASRGLLEPPQPQQPQQPQFNISAEQSRRTSTPAPAAGGGLGTYQKMINRDSHQLAALGNPQKNLNDLYARQTELATSERDAAIAYNKAQEERALEEAAVLELHNREMREKEEVRQKAVNELMEGYKKEEQEFLNSEMEEEHGMKTFGLALAAGLMALGAGMAGRDASVGMKMINNYHERRMQKYRLELNKRSKSLGMKKDRMSMLADKHGEERIADQAQQTKEWAAIEQKAKTDAHRYQNTRLEKAYQQQLLGIQEKKAQSEIELLNMYNSRILQTQKQMDDVQFRNRQIGLERQKLSMMSNKGAGGKQLKESTILKLADQKAVYRQMTALEKMFDEKTGPMSWLNQLNPASDAAEYERYAGLLRDSVLRLRSGAQINEAEMKRLTKLIPTASTWDSKGKAAFAAFKLELAGIYNSRRALLRDSGFDVSGVNPISDLR